MTTSPEILKAKIATDHSKWVEPVLDDAIISEVIAEASNCVNDYRLYPRLYVHYFMYNRSWTFGAFDPDMSVFQNLQESGGFSPFKGEKLYYFEPVTGKVFDCTDITKDDYENAIEEAEEEEADYARYGSIEEQASRDYYGSR